MDIVEMKLHCPLRFFVSPNASVNFRYEAAAKVYADKTDIINEKIGEDMRSEPLKSDRGLALYLRARDFRDNIISVIPSVEIRDGKPYGAITVKALDELNGDEMDLLLDELAEQLSDGWGKAFAQNTIDLDGDIVSVVFWSGDPDDRLLNFDDDMVFCSEDDWFFENAQQYGGNTMDERNTNNVTELKLYCPLRFLVAPENNEGDRLNVKAYHFSDCADKINEKIIENIKSDETAAERGLAVGFVNAELESKIISAFPGVENCGRELYGVVTVKRSGELSVEEMGKLAAELSARIADDWGKRFENTPIDLGGKSAYILFLTEDHGEVFLIPKNDEYIDQMMGGLT